MGDKIEKLTDDMDQVARRLCNRLVRHERHLLNGDFDLFETTILIVHHAQLQLNNWFDAKYDQQYHDVLFKVNMDKKER